MCSKSKMLILTSQGEPAPLPYLCIPLPTPVFLQNALGSLAMLTSIYWSNQTSHSSLHPWFQCCAQIIHTFGLNKRRAADGINWNQMESIGIRWNQLESDGIKYSTPLGWTNAERQMETDGIRWNLILHTFGLNKRRAADGIKWNQMEFHGIRWNQILHTFGLNTRRVADGIRWESPRANASAGLPSRTFKCQSACILQGPWT